MNVVGLRPTHARSVSVTLTPRMAIDFMYVPRALFWRKRIDTTRIAIGFAPRCATENGKRGYLLTFVIAYVTRVGCCCADEIPLA